MQLDDLQLAWKKQGALLERSLAVDERILRELLIGRVGRTLRRYALGRAVEIGLAVLVLACVMRVVAEHGAEPRYLGAGAGIAVVAIGVAVLSASLLVRVLRLDHGGRVTAIQRELEGIRMAEYRATKWALLGGVVVWLPALLVAFEALTGLAPLARVDPGFLVVNLLFGLTLLALGQVLSRMLVERPDLGPRARLVVDALSGRGLRIAAGHLDELARFESGNGDDD